MREGGVEKWYLADQDEVLSAKYFRIASVYIATVLLEPVQGTVLGSGISNLWDTLTENMKPSMRAQLKLLNKKIRYSGFGRKDYTEKNKVLKEILGGIIHQRKIQIAYQSFGAQKTKYQAIHPYTILLHRDSFYVHAYVERSEEIRTFLIDRVQEVTPLNDGFKYPANFDPDKFTEDSFGIYVNQSSQAERIVISFDEQLWDYITCRKWHRSQHCSKIKDGRFTMEITLSNQNEFVLWIMQFGKDAKILKPESLRQKVKQSFLEAYETY